MSERIVIERRARATGTVVQLVYAPDADPAQPWETICVDHGGVCSHQTRAVARDWLSHPDEWCEACMYGPTTSGEPAFAPTSTSTPASPSESGPGSAQEAISRAPASIGGRTSDRPSPADTRAHSASCTRITPTTEGATT